MTRADPNVVRKYVSRRGGLGHSNETIHTPIMLLPHLEVDQESRNGRLLPNKLVETVFVQRRCVDDLKSRVRFAPLFPSWPPIRRQAFETTHVMRCLLHEVGGDSRALNRI